MEIRSKIPKRTTTLICLRFQKYFDIVSVLKKLVISNRDTSEEKAERFIAGYVSKCTHAPT
jgi:hypothetical protein